MRAADADADDETDAAQRAESLANGGDGSPIDEAEGVEEAAEPDEAKGVEEAAEPDEADEADEAEDESDADSEAPIDDEQHGRPS